MSGESIEEDALRGWRDVVRPALATVILILPVGALAVLAREPLLFPSLGPTVFIQAHAPKSPAARPWNNLAGHVLGVLGAVTALWVTGSMHDPPTTSAALTWGRALASALAVGLTTAAQLPLRAAHPPSAATTLLITLGAVPCDAHAIGVIFVGVILTVILERLVRPWLLRGCLENGYRWVWGCGSSSGCGASRAVARWPRSPGRRRAIRVTWPTRSGL